MTIAALLLAAGESTRMGRLKQLLPWDGRPLVAWQAEQLREAGADEVVVVLGHAADEVRAAVPSWARIVVNESYREGRATSLRRGAEALVELNQTDAADGPFSGDRGVPGSDDHSGSDIQAILILNVDQPRPAWISRRLIERWRLSGAPLVSPRFTRRFGHPVLLDGALLSELRLVDEATLGLRAVTQRHVDKADSLPVAVDAIDVDLNTPGDYESALASFLAGAWDEPS